MVVASCGTLPKGASETKDVKTVVETRYLPGKVITTPYPTPDTSLTPDVEPLSEDFIDGDDITPQSAMDTAVQWSKQYHSLAADYNTLKGWIAGVVAGQTASGLAIDAPPVESGFQPDLDLTPE